MVLSTPYLAWTGGRMTVSFLAADPMPQCSLRPPRPSQQSSYLVMPPFALGGFRLLTAQGLHAQPAQQASSHQVSGREIHF